MIRVYDQVGNVIETHEHTGDFKEWYRLSQPFLDPAKTRNDYLTDFLAHFAKVRGPTGEGQTKQKGLESALKLAPDELPLIPRHNDAPEEDRRVMAYHREMSRLCGGDKYFLSYRDVAKVCPRLTPQKAYNITLALFTLGVIGVATQDAEGDS